MPRSGWAAHGNRSLHHAKRAASVAAIDRVDGVFFERAGVSPAEWKALAAALVGRLVLPGMPDYDKDRASNPRFDEHPLGIAYCATPEDIRLSLALARAHRDMKVTCRSGGHSTAGFSVNNGLVLDLSMIAYACVEPAEMAVTAGAGTSFALFDSVLDSYGLHVPSGGCPDVCVGGYMQGGGYGFTSRQFGINCDRVRAFTMVLADGRLVSADRGQNTDLFWAVRGGTGNQFGVLVEATYELVELRMVACCVAYWPLERAAVVLDALQREYMRSGVTRRFGYQVMITTIDGKPTMLLLGMYPGTIKQILELVEPLTGLVKPERLDTYFGTYDKLNATLVDKVLPGPGTPGTLELKRCGFIAAPLGVEGWAAICEYLKSAQPNPYNMAYLEPYGGAIEDLAPLSNAFIHRKVDCDFVVDAFWNPAWKDSYPGSQNEEQAQAWLDGLWKIVGPRTNGHVYQDYPDSGYSDYRWQYWGDAFPTLLAVKKRHDPSGLFSYGQAISPYPEGPDITRSTHASLF